MKNANIIARSILSIFVITSCSSIFSVGATDIDELVNKISSLRIDAEAFAKLEQMSKNPEKSITDLRIKRVLDSLGLIDANGKLNKDTQDNLTSAYRIVYNITQAK